MTQKEARRRLDDYEMWIVDKWPTLSEFMRSVIMHSRRGLIEQLQRIQLEEFDRK